MDPDIATSSTPWIIAAAQLYCTMNYYDDGTTYTVPDNADAVLDAFYIACHNGHLEIVECARRFSIELTADIVCKSLVAAAERKHADIVKHLLTSHDIPFAFIQDTFIQACSDGNCSVAAVFLTFSPFSALHPIYFELAVIAAGKNGHTPVLHLFSSVFPEPHVYCSGRVICELISYAPPPTLEWLMTLSFYENLHQHMTSTWMRYMSSALSKACSKGHLPLSQWVFGIAMASPSDLRNVFIDTCVLGHDNIIKWLLTKVAYQGNNLVEKGFMNACRYGHLSVAQYIYASIPAHLNPVYVMGAFIKVCVHGHSHILSWLITLPDIHVVSPGDITFAFCNASLNGHLDTAICLHTRWSTHIYNIMTMEPSFIPSLCSKGHMAILQWILDQYPYIDISANENAAFGYACMFGHVNIAKWIYDRCPPLRNLYVLHPAEWFYNSPPEIAEWLAQIYPYRYRLDNNGHRVVLSEQDLTWKRREKSIMLWKRQYTAPHSHILSCVPDDIARVIITYI